MTILSLDIDYAKFKKYGLRRRDLDEAMRATLAAMGERWHAEYLPLHFEESAYSRYRYYKRKGMNLVTGSHQFRRSTVGRKLRYKGHNRPLVWSGESMIRALGPIRLRVTSQQARVLLPQKFNFRHRNSRIRMRDEVTRVLPSERAELVEFGRKFFRSFLQNPKG